MLQDSFEFAVYFNGCQVQFHAAGDILARKQRHPQTDPLIQHTMFIYVSISNLKLVRGHAGHNWP